MYCTFDTWLEASRMQTWGHGAFEAWARRRRPLIEEYGMIYFLDPICIMRRLRWVTPKTAIFEGLETLLRLARNARAGGGEQDPVAVAGSAVGVFFLGRC